MSQLTVIEMGGVACAITSGDSRLSRLVEQRYQGFSSTHLPQFYIEAECVASPQHGESPLEILNGPVRTRLEGQFLEIKGEGFKAHFDFLSGRGHIRQPLNLTPLDLLLKAVYGYRLFQKDAFFVHSCAVVREGGASLFFGPSGSGKSTIARMAQGQVLADELVIVSKDQKGKSRDRSAYSVYGTPFWGGVNFRVPLSKLFALNFNRQESSLKAMDPVQTLRKLLCCIGYFTPSPQQQRQLLKLAVSLVQGLPCHELTFSPQPQFWSWFDAQHN
jgi:hypothetical protein